MLGRYRLRRRLGAGGFATVWLARDERLDREVAVKILPRERVAGGRFEREARAAARLAHPGIVTLFEAAVDDEGAYLVSELVHGATLDDLLAAGRLSDRDILQVGIALCDALSHAHAHGVIHRDVKPSNVLIPARATTPAQLARLTDFGVAKILESRPSESLTLTGDVIGTAAYMAPEQAQGLPAGAAADLFSLALVLYEALSGVNPLRASASASAGAGAAMRNPRRSGTYLPPLRRQRRELPRELGRAVDLALRPRAVERGTVEELRAALVSALGRVGDEPGVVAAPWPERTLIRDVDDDEPEAHEEGDAELGGWRRRAARKPRIRDATATEGLDERGTPAARAGHAPWGRRALAGVATAGLTAWLASRVPGASPVPAPLAACLAGLVVAVLPRVGWLVVVAGISGSVALHSRPGGALLLLAAGLVPLVLAPRDGSSWPLAAAAPALNAIGLGTAWPALAGFAGTARRRAVLAATGWLWIALAGGGLSTTTGLHDAFTRVIRPLLTVGTPATCAAWALAALVLPLTRIRRSPELEYMRVAAWSTGLALVTIATSSLGGAGLSLGSALLGAYLGGLVAIVTRRVAVRVSGRPNSERMRSDRVA